MKKYINSTARMDKTNLLLQLPVSKLSVILEANRLEKILKGDKIYTQESIDIIKQRVYKLGQNLWDINERQLREIIFEKYTNFISYQFKDRL